jgi:hypothetical protein
MEIDIPRLKELIEKREAIDAEIASVASGNAPARKSATCSVCKSEGHTARNCPSKGAE